MVIYSQKLAATLMLRGFVLQGLEKNKDKSGKNIFYFKDSDEIKNAISEYSKNKKTIIQDYL